MPRSQQWAQAVKASELIGLKGEVRPEQISFDYKDICLLVEPHPDGGMKVGGTNTVLKLNFNEYFLLKSSGEIFRIKNPDEYKEPARQLLARTKLGQNLLIFSDEMIIVPRGCSATVLVRNEAYDTSDDVQKLSGHAVIVKCGGWIHEIVIRTAKAENQVVLAFLKVQLRNFAQKESGLFDHILREAWEPWVLEAASEYYSNTPANGNGKKERPSKASQKTRRSQPSGQMATA